MLYFSKILTVRLWQWPTSNRDPVSNAHGRWWQSRCCWLQLSVNKQIHIKIGFHWWFVQLPYWFKASFCPKFWEIDNFTWGEIYCTRATEVKFFTSWFFYFITPMEAPVRSSGISDFFEDVRGIWLIFIMVVFIKYKRTVLFSI